VNTKENTVYLNKCLKNNQVMHDKVLNHELKHGNKAYNLADALYDLKPDIMLLRYSLSEPSTWTSILPFIIQDKKLVINPINTIIYTTFTLYLCYILKWIT